MCADEREDPNVFVESGHVRDALLSLEHSEVAQKRIGVVVNDGTKRATASAIRIFSNFVLST